MPWTYVISDLNTEEITGMFYKKELEKTNKKEFRLQKVTKRKDSKSHVKWKGYNNSFSGWIDKKYIVKMSQYFPKPRPLGGNTKI